MPLIVQKRQSTSDCPAPYDFYDCSTPGANWSGCCSVNACSPNVGCPPEHQLIIAITDVATSPAATSTSESDSSITGDSSASVTTPIATGDITEGFIAAETDTSASTTLGGEDPSIQTVENEYRPHPLGDEDPSHDVPAIIGATVGAFVLVCLISLFFFCNRRRMIKAETRKRREGIMPYVSEKDDPTQPPPKNDWPFPWSMSGAIAKMYPRKDTPASAAPEPLEIGPMGLQPMTGTNGESSKRKTSPHLVPGSSKSANSTSRSRSRSRDPGPTPYTEISHYPTSPTSQTHTIGSASTRVAYDVPPPLPRDSAWTHSPSARGRQHPAFSSSSSKSSKSSGTLTEDIDGRHIAEDALTPPKPATKSRATGATYTPAKSATTTPTIRVTGH